MSEGVESKEQVIQVPCRCPFCEVETPQLFPFCTGCGARLVVCASCSQPISQDSEACPNCGAKVDK